MKKTLVLILALAMLLTMFGCKSTDTTAPSENTTNTAETVSGDNAADTAEAAGKTIAVIIPDPAFTFCTEMARGVRENMREEDTYLEYAYNYDVATQAEIVDDLITKNVDAIIIEVLDVESLIAPLRKCKDAGIPVFLMDGRLPDENEELAQATVENDTYNIGYLQGKSLCEEAGGSGELAYLAWVNGGTACTGRIEGFEAAVAEYPDMKIVSAQECETTTDAALESITATLQLYPELKGFCAFFGQAGLAAVPALESAGMADSCKLCVSDFDADFGNYIKNGKIYSGVFLNTPNMGKLAIGAAYDFLDGTTTEIQHLVNSEQTEVKTDNVDEFLALLPQS